MEKIFNVRIKIRLWHSGPLKFAGVGKFLSRVPLYNFLKIDNGLKIKIFVLNQ